MLNNSKKEKIIKKIYSAKDFKKELIKFIKRKNLKKSLEQTYLDYVKFYFGKCQKEVKLDGKIADLKYYRLKFKENTLSFTQIKGLKELIAETKKFIKETKSTLSTDLSFIVRKEITLFFNFSAVIETFCVFIQEAEKLEKIRSTLLGEKVSNDISFVILIHEFETLNKKKFSIDNFDLILELKKVIERLSLNSNSD